MRRGEIGFTLVELAITIVIVGLLVAAVLGAGQLRMNAALQSTIARAASYGAATAIFLDRYGALPGDLPEAASKIPGCENATCEAAGPAAGDGNVGTPGAITRHQTGAATQAERETVLFWRHLILTELISDIATEPGSDPAWGRSHPAAALGGGFHVKDANGGSVDRLPGWPPGADQPSGTFVVLQAGVEQDLFPANKDGQALTATQAAALDRKADDGDPLGGYVVAYGTATFPMIGRGCITWVGTDRGVYEEDDASRDCGLAFEIAP